MKRSHLIGGGIAASVLAFLGYEHWFSPVPQLPLTQVPLNALTSPVVHDATGTKVVDASTALTAMSAPGSSLVSPSLTEFLSAQYQAGKRVYMCIKPAANAYYLLLDNPTPLNIPSATSRADWRELVRDTGTTP
jgi:hypothetical protein